MGASYSKPEVIPDDPDDAPHEPTDSETDTETTYDLDFLSWGWFI